MNRLLLLLLWPWRLYPLLREELRPIGCYRGLLLLLLLVDQRLLWEQRGRG